MSAQPAEEDPYIWVWKWAQQVTVTLPERLWFVTGERVTYSPTGHTGRVRVERVVISGLGFVQVKGRAWTGRVSPYTRAGSMPIADLPPEVKDYLLLHIAKQLVKEVSG